jgi:hypothetical protein
MSSLLLELSCKNEGRVDECVTLASGITPVGVTDVDAPQPITDAVWCAPTTSLGERRRVTIYKSAQKSKSVF